MICDACGIPYNIGEWPWCPHGSINRAEQRHFRFDNYVDQHIAPWPVEVTSPAHRERLMRENHLEPREREHINDLNHRRWRKGLPPLAK